MDAVASSNRDRAAVVAEGVPLPLGAPCHAVRVGDLVFVGAVDAPEDTAAPSTIILERLDAVLRAAGLGLKWPLEFRANLGSEPALTDRQKAEARRRLTAGESARSIARDYKVAASTVGRLQR